MASENITTILVHIHRQSFKLALLLLMNYYILTWLHLLKFLVVIALNYG